jgi:K+-transporting ATPase KdpF subunit
VIGSRAGLEEISMEYAIALAIAVALGVYLFVALLRPERF